MSRRRWVAGATAMAVLLAGVFVWRVVPRGGLSSSALYTLRVAVGGEAWEEKGDSRGPLVFTSPDGLFLRVEAVSDDAVGAMLRHLFEDGQYNVRQEGHAISSAILADLTLAADHVRTYRYPICSGDEGCAGYAAFAWYGCTVVKITFFALAPDVSQARVDEVFPLVIQDIDRQLAAQTV